MVGKNKNFTIFHYQNFMNFKQCNDISCAFSAVSKYFDIHVVHNSSQKDHQIKTIDAVCCPIMKFPLINTKSLFPVISIFCFAQ